MAKVTIDGREIHVEEGTLILDAAKSIGIHIPTFCFQAKLSRLASCRLCLVEIEGQRKLQPSCVTPVLEGMVINTNTPAVVSARRAMLEFILANHPLDCPVCDKGGECELQDMVFTYGPREGRFAEEKRVFHARDYVLSPVIIKNANRCVQCQRCVRMCEEIVGAVALGSIGRGAGTEETGFLRGPLNCDHCGNCIEVCPVGSLMSLPYRYKARPWDLKEIDTICPYCGTGCHITVGLRDGSLMRVRSKKDTGINQETLCVKGRFGLDFVGSDQRVKRPMIRKNDILVSVSWREARNFLMERLKGLVEAKKPFGGVASPTLTNEELYLFQKLMRVVFRTNNIDSSVRWLGSVETSTPLFYNILGQLINETHNGNPLPKILNGDSIIVIGSQITDENPVTEYSLRRRLLFEGGSIFFLNSRPTRLDSLSKTTIGYLPGEEYHLISTILMDLIENCSNKKKTLKKTFSNIEEMAKALSGAERFLSDESSIDTLVKEVLGSQSISFFIGTDILRSPLAAFSLQALLNMIRILRALGKDVEVQILSDRCNQRGAWDMGVLPTHMPGYIALEDKKGTSIFEEIWNSPIPQESGMDFNQMLDKASKGEMGGLYIVGEDPLLYSPDGRFVEDALKRLDLLIVQDAFLTETARMADIVLPGATFAEKDGTFTNNEGRLQKVRGFFNPAFETKRDGEIFSEVASLMGYDQKDFDSREAFEEIRQVMPSYNVPLDDLGSDGIITGPYKKTPQTTLYITKPLVLKRHKDKKLITGNHLFHSGNLSERSRILSGLLENAFVEIGYEDALKLGIEDNEEVFVKSNGDKLKLMARINRKFKEGIVFIPENFSKVRLNILMKRGVYPWVVSVEKA